VYHRDGTALVISLLFSPTGWPPSRILNPKSSLKLYIRKEGKEEKGHYTIVALQDEKMLNFQFNCSNDNYSNSA
jgi:hypothetical protein